MQWFFNWRARRRKIAGWRAMEKHLRSRGLPRSAAFYHNLIVSA